MKLLLLSLLLLVGCKASYYCKKCKEKGIVKIDTVYQEKTVIKPGDTTTIYVPQWSKVRDTTIFKDRIKVHYTVVHDTLRTQIECPSDTIKIKVPVTVTETISCPPTPTTWRTVAFVLIGLLALLVAFVARK